MAVAYFTDLLFVDNLLDSHDLVHAKKAITILFPEQSQLNGILVVLWNAVFKDGLLFPWRQSQDWDGGRIWDSHLDVINLVTKQ
jgi:hypothetical protein